VLSNIFDKDGVSEDENLPYGQNTTAAAAAASLYLENFETIL